MEYEIKVAVQDPEDAARRLESLGARLESPRALEDNQLWDWPDRSLASSGRLLRIREIADKVVVTAKAPAGDSPVSGDGTRYKIRRESETLVPDARAMAAVLETAGFVPLWRYQKYRRTYSLEGAEVVVDETPAGNYLEIEGEPEVIERVVTRLELEANERITGSYWDLWQEVCRHRGEEPGDMLFAETDA